MENPSACEVTSPIFLLREASVHFRDSVLNALHY
jgi:hypothetical protein